MKLYEIAESLRNISNRIEAGDLPIDDGFEQLSAATADFNAKVDSLLVFIKEAEADHEALNEESCKLIERSRARLNHAKRLREYLAGIMASLEMKSYSGIHGQVTLQRGTSAVVVEDTVDLRSLPDELKRVLIEPNRTAMKEWAGAGKQLPAGIWIKTAPPTVRIK